MRNPIFNTTHFVRVQAHRHEPIEMRRLVQNRNFRREGARAFLGKGSPFPYDTSIFFHKPLLYNRTLYGGVLTPPPTT